MVDFRPRSIPPVRPSSKKTEPLKRLGILENPREFFARLRKKKISGMVIVASVFLSLFVLGILFVGIIYLMFLRSLPPITDIENLTLPESSVIRDKNGNELYSIFSEKDGKRTFVPLSGVSQDVIDALISTEDKTFFENQGIDFRSLVRSVSNYVFGKTDTIKGTSTISQQLIKNTFLNNERSFARKIKEAYLSYRLNSEYSKEKILELYLNKISYGHNASGVEEASKIFFGKSAKDVGILGSTILASLPKGPTYFSPYNQRDRLMGNLYVYQDDKVEEKINLGTPESRKEYRPLINLFRERISGLQMTRINGEDVKICGLSLATLKEKYSLDSEGCGRFAYKDILGILNNIRIVSPDVPLIIEATPTPAVVVTPKK